MLVVLAIINCGLSGLATAGVVAGVVGGITTGGVAGVVGVVGGVTGVVDAGGAVVAGVVDAGGAAGGAVVAGAWGVEQPASSITAAATRRMVLNKVVLFNICFIAIIPSLSFRYLKPSTVNQIVSPKRPQQKKHLTKKEVLCSTQASS